MLVFLALFTVVHTFQLDPYTDLSGNDCTGLFTPLCDPAALLAEDPPYYSIDGTCNNLRDPEAYIIGSANRGLIRETPGVIRDEAVLAALPSAREVSNTISDQVRTTRNTVSSMLWWWGQFLDHDMALVLEVPSIMGETSNDQVEGGHTFLPAEPGDSENGILPPGMDMFEFAPSVRLCPNSSTRPDMSTNSISNPCGCLGDGFGEEFCLDPPSADIMNCVDCSILGNLQERELSGCNANNFPGITLAGIEDCRLICFVLENPMVITHWIDGSMVYGSDIATAYALRDSSGNPEFFRDGLLETTTFDVNPPAPGEFMPYDPVSNMFFAGDMRSNEQTGLATMHTLFVRNHNRLAIQERENFVDPIGNCDTVCDENTYQAARRRNIATLQHITFYEYLPLVLGLTAIPQYVEYNPMIDGEVYNEFAAAAYRFGHTLINEVHLRQFANGTTIPEGNVALSRAFFDPTLIINERGLEPMLRGAVRQEANDFDVFIVNPIRNLLFQNDLRNPTADLIPDLMSRNVERGRDHHMPFCNDFREVVGLQRYSSFEEINPDDPVQTARLAEVYQNVDELDLIVCGFAEPPFEGGVVGETFQDIIADQFIRIRDGDRLWYEQFDDLVADTQGLTFRDIIVANTEIEEEELRADVFVSDPTPPPPPIQPVLSCTADELPLCYCEDGIFCATWSFSNAETLEMTLRSNSEYAAVGWNTNGLMFPADVYTCAPNLAIGSDGELIVVDHFNENFQAPRLDTVRVEGSNDAVFLSSDEDAVTGIRSCTFERPLMAQNSEVDFTIPTDGEDIFMIWSVGVVNELEGRLVFHTARGSTEVDMAQGFAAMADQENSIIDGLADEALYGIIGGVGAALILGCLVCAKMQNMCSGGRGKWQTQI